MFRLGNLTMRNFLSIGNVTQAVNLDIGGLTLVLGANTDAHGGESRNGAGKTTILQAVCFALFGKPLTKIKLPNLVNNINGGQMLVTLEFAVNGETYRVERGKSPDVMRFHKNGVEQLFKSTDDKTKGENKETQIEINRLVGMSHTMFKHIVALNTFTDPFLKMSVGDQRTLIEELLGVTQISQRAEVLKKLIVSTKDAIKTYEATIKAKTEANDRLRNAISNAEAKAAAWETMRARKLDALASELAKMETLDFDAEAAIFDAIDAYDAEKLKLQNERAVQQGKVELAEQSQRAARADVKRYEGDLARASSPNTSRLEGEVTRQQSEASRSRALAIEAASELEAARASLASEHTRNCPCCDQSIEGTDYLTAIVANLEQQVHGFEQTLARHTSDADARDAEAKSVQEEITKVISDARSQEAGVREQLEKAKDDETATAAVLSDIENHLAEIDTRIAAIGARPKTNFRNRDEVYRARADRENMEGQIVREMESENPNVNQIEDLKSALQEVDYAPINEQIDLLKHQEFLLKLLTSKDSFIRKKIVDQNLAYLNSRLHHYLDKLKLPHEVVFQSDLSVDITLLGRDMDFEQLSRGEMNRVIMSTSWAFRDVWESQNHSFNLCWTDELLDNGLDQQGVEDGLAILKSMARDRGKTVFLISHRDELRARIDKIMLVTKENGFTSIQAD